MLSNFVVWQSWITTGNFFVDDTSNKLQVPYKELEHFKWPLGVVGHGKKSYCHSVIVHGNIVA